MFSTNWLVLSFVNIKKYDSHITEISCSCIASFSMFLDMSMCISCAQFEYMVEAIFY